MGNSIVRTPPQNHAWGHCGERSAYKPTQWPLLYLCLNEWNVLVGSIGLCNSLGEASPYKGTWLHRLVTESANGRPVQCIVWFDCKEIVYCINMIWCCNIYPKKSTTDLVVNDVFQIPNKSPSNTHINIKFAWAGFGDIMTWECFLKCCPSESLSVDVMLWFAWRSRWTKNQFLGSFRGHPALVCDVSDMIDRPAIIPFDGMLHEISLCK